MSEGLTYAGGTPPSGYDVSPGLVNTDGTPVLYSTNNMQLAPGDDYQAPQYVDPYAQWGGQANYTRLVNQFNQGKNALFNSVNQTGDSKATEYKQSIRDWLFSDKNQQDAINSKGVNAEMARNQGTQGVLGMVGRGIRSAGVMLANKNAGNSSATGAIANAYGQIGREQLSNIGNQYGVAQNQIGLEQQNLEGSRGLQRGKFEDYKTETVNSIVSSAEQQMAALNAQAADSSLPDRIAIEQEKNRIRSETMAKLQAFDAELAGQAKATSREARMTEGRRLSSLGQAPSDTFQFTTEAPMTFQGSAPAGGNLPLFTYRNRKQG